MALFRLLKGVLPSVSLQTGAFSSFQCQRFLASSPALSPGLKGLQEFFEPLLEKDEDKRPVGKAWSAKLLREKSFDDLHKLWYVLLKERNMLDSEKMRYKALNRKMPNPIRKTKVRHSMARIKHVMTERAIALEDKEMQGRLYQMIHAM